MSRVEYCMDNGPTKGLWSIMKSEMYQMYEIKSVPFFTARYMSYRLYREIFICGDFAVATPFKVPSNIRAEDQYAFMPRFFKLFSTLSQYLLLSFSPIVMTRISFFPSSFIPRTT